MKINLQLWFESLKTLFDKDNDICVYDDPANYFDGFFTEMGLPCSPEYRPIWFEDGLVIYVERTGCTFVPEERCWKSCDEHFEYRVFWLSADGVFSEVSQKNGHLYEFFEASSPEAVAAYVGLLKKDKIEARAGQERQVMLSSIIGGLFVPFFRHLDDISIPDDLTVTKVPADDGDKQNPFDLPWVNVEAIRDVVSGHLDKFVPWMSLLFAEFRRSQLQKKVQNATGKDLEKKFLAEAEDGSKEGLSVREWQLREFEAFHDRPDICALRKLCFDSAAKVKDEDVISPPSASHLICSTIQYAYNGSFYELKLPVGIQLTREAFPDFFRANVNPKIGDALPGLGAGRIASNLGTKSPDIEVSLPSIAEQKRLAFEILHYRHSIRNKAFQLHRFDPAQEKQMDASSLYKVVALRYQEVEGLTKRTPSQNAELERVQQPLPNFLEALFLSWERSLPRVRVQNGLATFGNLLRVVALLGFEELSHSCPLGLIIS